MSRTRARPTTKADESQEFVEFWDCWRQRMNRNDGRGAARDEFFRHVEEYGADPQDIADGAKWFIHNGGNDTENKYRIHASTWLCRRPYEDGAEMWRKVQALKAESQSNIVQIKRPEFQRPASHFMSKYQQG